MVTADPPLIDVAATERTLLLAAVAEYALHLTQTSAASTSPAPNRRAADNSSRRFVCGFYLYFLSCVGGLQFVFVCVLEFMLLAIINLSLSLWTTVAVLAPHLLRACGWLQACQLGTALCAVLLDIQDVTVQEPLLAAVVSVLAAPGLAGLLQADRPASAGGNSSMSSSSVMISSSSSGGGGVVFRQQFMQAALAAATKLIGVSGLEPVLLRHVTALVCLFYFGCLLFDICCVV